MSKPAPTNEAPDLSGHPRAGDVRRFATGEALVLAPLPLPLPVRPMDPKQFLVHIDQTYLDLDSSRHTAQAHQVMIGVPFFIGVIFIGLGFPLLIGTTAFGTDHTFWASALHAAIVSIPYGLFGGTLLFLIALHGFFHRMKQARRHPPVRFHRQRREVACFDPDTGQTLVAPFERVTAWMATSSGATPYGAMTHYNFGLTVEDAETGQSYTALFPASLPEEALGLWEAIRRYMDHGPGTLERPTKTFSGLPIDPREHLPYDGVHTLEIARKKLHEDLRDGFTSRVFVFFWYLYHLITFWKLPFRLATWEYHRSRAPIPPEIQAWSEPIPEHDWATPSPELEAAARRMVQAGEQAPDIKLPELLAAGIADWHPDHDGGNGNGNGNNERTPRKP
ncbi:hypothetical protein ACN2MM_03830 [Alkalilimnicola ehrlichii MLHE-1]|uniref:Transmembrane protein n=1 Tax=Alkalilimnicola ehrlichii (strain ATCC BAA-1101 / DSM 17681 / MLHE-1) TaxID=187272 RepID=Q0AAY6_ALKEH|nr:hypothetical protein [Alkalilimnicola ehrlichii]ABI56001.1 hypothetical protein Mlg_0647 [Alkalilimnicola ehrlichii MLHE-1]